MAAPNPLAGVDRWSSYAPRTMAGHLRDYDLREPLHADGSQILGLDSLAIPVMNTTPVPGYTTQPCVTELRGIAGHRAAFPHQRRRCRGVLVAGR